MIRFWLFWNVIFTPIHGSSLPAKSSVTSLLSSCPSVDECTSYSLGEILTLVSYCPRIHIIINFNDKVISLGVAAASFLTGNYMNRTFFIEDNLYKEFGDFSDKLKEYSADEGFLVAYINGSTKKVSNKEIFKNLNRSKWKEVDK